MNSTFQFLKTKGLKLALPLLLLTTACGDGTTSTSQGDVATVSSEGSAVAASATPSSGFGTPTASSAGLPTPQVNVAADDSEEVSLSDALPPVSDADHSDDAVGDAATVPEPAALLGLAVAAAGIVTLKRKQSA